MNTTGDKIRKESSTTLQESEYRKPTDNATKNSQENIERNVIMPLDILQEFHRANSNNFNHNPLSLVNQNGNVNSDTRKQVDVIQNVASNDIAVITYPEITNTDKNYSERDKTVLCNEKTDTFKKTDYPTNNNLVENVIVQDKSMQITKETATQTSLKSAKESDIVVVEKVETDLNETMDEKKTILELYGTPIGFDRMKTMVDVLKTIRPDVYKEVKRETNLKTFGKNLLVTEVITIDDDNDTGNVFTTTMIATRLCLLALG